MSHGIYEDNVRRAQEDFEKHFGRGHIVQAYVMDVGQGKVVVVEDEIRRAVYSMDVELIKIIKLTETD